MEAVAGQTLCGRLDANPHAGFASAEAAGQKLLALDHANDAQAVADQQEAARAHDVVRLLIHWLAAGVVLKWDLHLVARCATLHNMKTKASPTPKPVSLRIDPATRADVDYLIECSGLKEAQVIRLAVKRAAEQARAANSTPLVPVHLRGPEAVVAVAPKATRRKR